MVVQGQSTQYRNIPDSMASMFNIKYQIPGAFNYCDTLIAWRINDTGNSGNFFAPVMQSEDKKCMLLYAISPWYFLDAESFEATDCCPDKAFFRGVNLAHRNSMMFYLTDMLGTRDFNPDDYLSFLSQKKAEKWFNADSVFIFDVSPVKQITILDRTYRHCTMMYLSRYNRPFMMFVLFFSDDGVKKKIRYISKLKKNIWYNEGEWIFNERRWFDWMGRGFFKAETF